MLQLNASQNSTTHSIISALKKIINKSTISIADINDFHFYVLHVLYIFNTSARFENSNIKSENTHKSIKITCLVFFFILVLQSNKAKILQTVKEKT